MEESRYTELVPYNYWKTHTSMESYFAEGVLDIFLQYATTSDYEAIGMPGLISMLFDGDKPSLDDIVNGTVLKIIENKIFGKESKYSINWCLFLDDFISRLVEYDPQKILLNKIRSQYMAKPTSFVSYNSNCDIVRYVINEILDYVSDHYSECINVWEDDIKEDEESMVIVNRIVSDAPHNIITQEKAMILYIMNKTLCDSIYKTSKQFPELDHKHFNYYQFCISRFVQNK